MTSRTAGSLVLVALLAFVLATPLPEAAAQQNAVTSTTIASAPENTGTLAEPTGAPVHAVPNPLTDPVALIGLAGPMLVYFLKNLIPRNYRALTAASIGVFLDFGLQLLGAQLPPGIITAMAGVGALARNALDETPQIPIKL